MCINIFKLCGFIGALIRKKKEFSKRLCRERETIMESMIKKYEEILPNVRANKKDKRIDKVSSGRHCLKKEKRLQNKAIYFVILFR